jgi:hypothetical protein
MTRPQLRIVTRDRAMLINLYDALLDEELRKSPASQRQVVLPSVSQSSRTGARKSGTFFDSGWIGVALMMLTAMCIGAWFAVGHS